MFIVFNREKITSYIILLSTVLVLFGTGIAVVSGGNLVATSLAFGLSIVAMAYVIGNISGCQRTDRTQSGMAESLFTAGRRTRLAPGGDRYRCFPSGARLQPSDHRADYSG